MSSSKKKTPVNTKISKPKLQNFNYQFLFLIGIIILTIIVYYKSIHNGFISDWDDGGYVSNNHDITDLSLHGLKTLFTSFYVGNYLPFTMLTYALEYKYFGLNPTAYHIDNLILHLLNTILVFFFVKSLLSNQSSVIRPQTSDLSPHTSALICALLFAIHPMHVESVAWIAERKDVLYTFFYLASLIFYLTYIQNLSASSEHSTFSIKRLTFYLFSLFFFIFSLLSKSMAVTLPVVLLLLDYYKGRLNFKSKISYLISHIFLEKLPFFICSIILGIATIKYQQGMNDTDRNVLNLNIVDRFLELTYSISFYIVKLFSPFDFSAIYPFPAKTGNSLPIQYYLSPLLIIGLLYLIFKLSKQANANFKLIVLGILFYLITVSVVLMIIPVGHTLVAERYTYIPYLGFFIIIVSIFNNLISKIQKSKLIFYLCFLLFILYFSFLTYSRTEVWKNEISLFTDVIEKQPDVSIAYNNRGLAIANTGDYKAAMEDYDKAIALNPQYAIAFNNRGDIKLKSSDFKGAAEDFGQAIKLSPDFTVAYYNRGVAKANAKDLKGAIEDYNKAISLSPDFAVVYYNRGLAKANTNDFKGAMDDYNKVISLNPTFDLAYINRACLKETTSDFKEAMKDFDIAISLNPNNAMAYYDRGLTKGNLHDFKGALDDLNNAIALNPNYAMAFFNRGNVYLSMKDISSACEDWNSALKLGLPDAQNNISIYCINSQMRIENKK